MVGPLPVSILPFPGRMVPESKILHYNISMLLYYNVYWRKLDTMPDTAKKTTVRVNKDLHKELKKKAAEEGKTLDKVVEETVKKGLMAS